MQVGFAQCRSGGMGLEAEDDTEMKCSLNIVARDLASTLNDDQLDMLWGSTDLRDLHKVAGWALLVIRLEKCFLFDPCSRAVTLLCCFL